MSRRIGAVTGSSVCVVRLVSSMRAMIANAAASDEWLSCKVRDAEFEMRSEPAVPPPLIHAPRTELCVTVAADARRSRKLQRELRADADFAIYADPAAVAFDNPTGGREPKPAATAFGGIEGVEHFHRRPLVHANT